MPEAKHSAAIEGEITNVFAHRFVVRTAKDTVLVDLGPKWAEKISPKVGDKVKLFGDQKASELKVTTFERNGEIVETGEARDDDHQHEHEPADPAAARAAVEKLGHTVTAEPHRKPKHFEILGRDAEGRFHEHHVELDGKIRKTTEGNATHEKWTVKAS